MLIRKLGFSPKRGDRFKGLIIRAGMLACFLKGIILLMLKY
jgi:hypothetical protein